MATINGRFVKILAVCGKPFQGEAVGVARGWRPDSDWMMVHLLDGSRQQVHYTDKIEVLPADYKPAETASVDQ